MPGSLEVLIDGKKSSKLTLPEVDLPAMGQELIRGDAVVLTLRNTGTTRLRAIKVRLIGQGAGRVEFHDPLSKQWLARGENLELRGELAPKNQMSVMARGAYYGYEEEDGRDFRLKVEAISVG